MYSTRAAVIATLAELVLYVNTGRSVQDAGTKNHKAFNDMSYTNRRAISL